MKTITILLALLVIFTSCEKQEAPEPVQLSINESSLTMHHGDKESLQASHECTWSSVDSLIASVNQSGQVKAIRVGETVITATHSTGVKASCLVKVEAVYNDFKEPVMVEGTDKAYVKAKESRTFDEETDNMLQYHGENNKVEKVIYNFKEGSVLSAMIQFNESSVNISDIVVGFLAERYSYVGEIGPDQYAYTDDHGKIAVLNYSSEAGMNILYYFE